MLFESKRPSFLRRSLVALAVAVGLVGAGAASASAATAMGASAARDAFFKGDVTQALALADKSGELWIGGLAAYRLKNYTEAFARFSALADVKSSASRDQADWSRSAAAFWAARSAQAAGDTAKAGAYLKIAASSPHTFYGMIAERRLRLDDGAGVIADLVRRPANPLQFPTPNLAPLGGFTLSKALVYALVRQESRFRADARGGGAYGLMQLTPATAARVAGDDKFTRDPSRLHDAGVNLRVGQDYVTKLLGAMKGDLLRTMAAYNCGPAVIQKISAQMGDAADTLLVIESMPGASTRDFVEKVMTNYWTYRGIFGATSPSLDAAATGSSKILASLDD